MNGWIRLLGVAAAIITIVRFLDDEGNGKLRWS
jgi:hypothetical protein